MRNKKKNEKVAYHTLHFICSLTKALRPKEKMSVSDWADKYMVLPGGSNKAGKFRSDSVPYQKEIMNAITDSAVTEVTVMSSAQIGKTTIVLCGIAYYIEHEPSTQLLVLPTLSLGEKFSKTRLAPMIRDIPVLRDKIAPAKSDVVNKMVVIEDTGVLLDKVVVSENETTYKADDDYVASINSEGYLVIALTNDGDASSLQKLNISYVKLNPDGVTAEDIIGGIDEKGVRSGIELLDEVFINTGVIPAIVTAPVFSKQKEVAAALEAKVRLIGSLHNAKAYVDIDSSESGAVNVFNVAKVKEKNVPQSELIDACWPMVNKNGNVLAFSSFAAALAQAVAAENGDIPDGIDNRELLVDGVCTEDGTPVKVIQGDANSYLNANGIITAIRLPEWKAWGNNTAMYPASKDPTKRWSKCVMMLNYLQNRFKTEYLSKVGRNAKVKFIKGIVDEYNASLNALVPDYLAGGEIIFDTAKNPPSSMLEGHYIFSTRYADYTPAEYIENDFVYDAQILTDTMEGGDE